MDELIYNQRQIPKGKWRYGFRSSAATGCGWIATYNALLLMGYRAQPEELIRYYQRMVPLIHGNAGTLVFAPWIAMRQMGFRVRPVLRRSRFDAAAKQADVCILYYRWREKWKLGAHFVALQYRDGSFTGYNTYRNSTGPDHYGESLADFLKRRKYFTPVLFAIERKK